MVAQNEGDVLDDGFVCLGALESERKEGCDACVRSDEGGSHCMCV